MNQCSTWVIGCVFACMTFSVSAQTSDAAYTLWLQSGKRTLPENVKTMTLTPGLMPDEVVEGYVYRLVQFYQIPDDAVRQQLAADGVLLLDYIPAYAWVTAIPETYDFQRFLSLGVRAIQPLAPADKLHRHLAEGDIPAHALQGDKVETTIRLYPHADLTRTAGQMARMGYTLVRTLPQLHALTVQVPLGSVWTMAAMPEIQYAEPVADPGLPEDTRGKSLHRANVLNSEYPGGRRYDGTGVNIAVRDDGHLGPHIDFQGRTDQTYATVTTGTHGDGVAGIMAGAGNLNPSNQGMAPGAFIYVLDYQADFLDSTLFLHQTQNMVITNSSYSNGCNAGYTLITQTVDKQAHENPSLLHVFSAGNSGTSNCGYGAGATWGNITGGHKMGKNVIATANLYADDVLEVSSSRGPANDGRIKPDIAANGQNQISTNPNNSYSAFGGTSGAAPGIAGVAAQLYHAYRLMHGGADPDGALIKAAMMNTAYDLGNIGPDFKYGWGRIDAARAALLLEENRYLESGVGNAGLNTHTVTVPANTKEVRIMLYWNDPEASPLSFKALVNDLNLSVTEPGGAVRLPWLLNPTPNASFLNLPAGNGVDDLNNVEQVAIFEPAAGTYTVTIEGAAIPSGTQKYYLVYEFIPDEIRVTYPIGGEKLIPGQVERIRWDAWTTNATSGGFTLEFSADSGTTWTTIGTPANPQTRHFDWTPPANVVTDKGLVRISRGSVSGQSLATFTTVGVPGNFKVDQVCPDFTRLTWNPVTGATAYTIYRLGTKFMDSVMTVPATPAPSADVPASMTGEYWFAVAARTANSAGRRTIAIRRGPGRTNCPIDNDVAAINAGAGITGPFLDCRAYTVPVTMTLKNESSLAMTQIPVFFQFGNLPPVSGTFTGVIPAGNTAVYSFPGTVTLSSAGIYPLKVWAVYPGDTIASNDTLYSSLEVVPSQTVGVPFLENFESYTQCSGEEDCAFSCTLDGDWYNQPNGSGDDMDWRVFSGPTATEGTGPELDHQPGTAAGNYLYVEASGSCNNKKAVVVSPCINLAGVTQPELTFWYHMNGSDIGKLRLDVNLNGFWINDFMPAIVGQQGDMWKKATVNLAPFAGGLITLRFRAETANGEIGDIALDDVALYDKAGPPVANFTADQLDVCVLYPVRFTNFSVNADSATWKWEFSPALAVYGGASTDTTTSPLVSFSTPGTYEARLIATGPNGVDTLIRTAYIQVTAGQPLNITEDFESGVFPPAGWTLEDPDGVFTWSPIQVPGITGQSTTAMYVNHYNYNASGEEDILGSMRINLLGTDQPKLVFDVAFARYSAQFSDSLRILASDDCGESFPYTIYYKGGSSLATVPDEVDEWFPAVGSDWRRDTVNLGALNPGTAAIRFVSITDFGNNLFIDNIQVIETGNPAPTPTFSMPGGEICEGQVITFTDLSAGNPTSWFWDFGQDATPATATTAGPHQVVYGSDGPKIVTLSAGNANGTLTTQQAFTLAPLADPDFTWSGIGAIFTFTNTSTGAYAYQWLFGDGGSSTDMNPVHSYTSNGIYDVHLIAFNDCGPDTLTQRVSVLTVGLTDLLAGAHVSLAPNPSQGLTTLAIVGELYQDWTWDILDLSGRRIEGTHGQASGMEVTRELDLRQLAPGLYFLRISAAGESLTLKLRIE
ncbi:MAG: S8 family serine peptidase [Bacteroidia bacterium]|nr:S8 family serine peptidase [Bacteroidia bacterium]